MLSNGGTFAGANSYGAGGLACMPSWLAVTRFTIRPGQR